VSGGVVYVSTLDGKLRMLDEGTGKLISSIQIGGSLLIQPSLGQDGNGRMALVLTDMGSTRWGPPFPGFIQALALPASAPTQGETGQVLLETQVVAVAAVAAACVLGVVAIRSRRAR
jgi:hypothetical protein